ncbi:armadillo repeat-containing protein 5 [Gymnogyps californianus]|uniref:armadillo repeat-containing protein 5 n=1 Tax=Gymnogyps californianus TaxID=33616 RepID=UPI0021C83BA0|nr:armadillo repeat-containing protein 5 [Gymnogyps californianus]
MSEPLGWCVEAVRAAAEPGLARALLALRTRHTRRPGGAARFRERGGLGPLLELLGPERPRRTLDLALSVLGNCCTEPGCRRQARRLGGVPRLVALLSSPGPESVQNRVARTLANLALEPDGARDVLDAGAGPLLVSLAASCGTPECLHSAARALRILGAAPAPRRALGRAGAVRALASRLASLSPAHPACPAVARALRGLTDSPGPSADDVAPALPALAALAAHAKRDHRQPALGAIANACARAPLRPALGAAGAVEAVTEEVRRALASPNVAGATVAVRALCLLCREAVNRARVRAAGGLGLLLRLLAEPRARPWRPRVLLALAAFAYDQEALAALEARGLVPLLADVLRARADEEEEDEEEEDEEEDEEEEDEAAASCDLPRELPGPPGAGAAAGSLRGLNCLPAALPPSSTAPPHCPSPPRRRLPPMGALALPRGVGEGDPWLPEAPALLLLGRLAAADEPSRALATAPVVSGLLRYLTGVPAPAPRAARVLQRLTGHPAFLGALVRAYVPSLLRSWLVLGLAPPQAEELSRPGGPRRPAAPPHPRQARLKELGEGLLRNLGAAAAAPFGVGLLTHMLRCGAPPARLACATALPLLARPASPARGLLWGGGAVALLLSATPHDLLLLPNGTHPGVPVARAALSQGSPVLGAMLGGAFAEARQAAVALGCAPRHPLLLLLHFVHGCRGRPRDECPLLCPPVSPAAAGAAIALARRYLVDGFEGVVAAAVTASPGHFGGPPHNVAPRLVRVARLARCPPRLARALMAAVAPRGAQPHLDMGEPWGGGDPLLQLPGDANGDLRDLEDDFGVPYEDLGDTRGDLGNVADPFGDPSMDVGGTVGEDEVDMEVKGPL